MGIQFIFYNGEMISKDQPILRAENRSFRYGDGVFETMKWKKKGIVLSHYHFERLFSSLKLIQVNAESITIELLLKKITELCYANDCLDLARIRLTVYRAENNKAEYLIESSPLEKKVAKWNEKGWSVDIHPSVRKSCDAFSNLKSANHLPYVMAELYREEKGLDECLILNTCNNICDGSKTNIFIVIGKKIYTPALHQGCINGIMRKFIIDELKKQNYVVKQTSVSVALLHRANEVFLTNAIRGVKWVESFKEKIYSCAETRKIYNSLSKDIEGVDF